MPWGNTSAMDEKTPFINEWRSGAWTMRALCAAFGISHTLGYSYIQRREEGGVVGLEELSRAPRKVTNKMPTHIEEAIVKLSKQHRRWGAEKLLTILAEQFSEEQWPAVST